MTKKQTWQTLLHQLGNRVPKSAWQDLAFAQAPLKQDFSIGGSSPLEPALTCRLEELTFIDGASFEHLPHGVFSFSWALSVALQVDMATLTTGQVAFLCA